MKMLVNIFENVLTSLKMLQHFLGKNITLDWSAAAHSTRWCAGQTTAAGGRAGARSCRRRGSRARTQPSSSPRARPAAGGAPNGVGAGGGRLRGANPRQWRRKCRELGFDVESMIMCHLSTNYDVKMRTVSTKHNIGLKGGGRGLCPLNQAKSISLKSWKFG
jgi:hypothetical protein